MHSASCLTVHTKKEPIKVDQTKGIEPSRSPDLHSNLILNLPLPLTLILAYAILELVLPALASLRSS